MLRKILLAAVAIVVLFLGFVATRPSTYAVERQTTVAAPPAVVYAELADFHRWEAWSPWAKLDPNVKNTYEGQPGAVGSKQEWSGNKDVGRGRMTVKDARPGERLGIDLEFIEPFASRADTDFVLSPDGAGTRVSWKMAGTMGFMEKAFGVFMNMDAMIGKDFEKGLAQLKAVAEKEASRPAPVPAAAP
ncbi:MAG: SRPBCC family protein [Anaeromyxobacter sp.]